MAEGMGIFGEAAQAAAGMGIRISAEELAALASDRGMGEGEIAAVRTVFSYLAEQRRQKTVDTLLRLSRLPSREPKTFEGFDFSRIQGRDAGMLRKLPALADLYAHRNIAFIGPEGIGKTHLAQAYVCFVNLSFHKTASVRFTRQREDSSRTSVALAPILSSPTTPRA